MKLMIVFMIGIVSFGLNVYASFEDLTPQEKATALGNYQRWQKMSPSDQAEVEKSWQKYEAMPPEKKKIVEQRYAQIKSLPQKRQDWILARGKARDKRRRNEKKATHSKRTRG